MEKGNPTYMRTILTLFGLGKIKYSASGASLLALLLFFIVNYGFSSEGFVINLLLFAIVLVGALLSALRHKVYLLKDPKEVVVDEFLGMYLALILAGTLSLWKGALLLVIFRVLDLAKPWPISSLDAIKSENAFLIDDIALGLFLGAVASFVF